MTTYGAALTAGRAVLADAGIDSAALDARLLLAAASGLEMAALIARDQQRIPLLAYDDYNAHISRRLKAEPVARILGEKEFWGLPIKVSPATLVPRPETETLVEAVLSKIDSPDQCEIAIADLGTGSGAIAIALLKELPKARAVATDISDEALDVARLNAVRLGVSDRIKFKRVDYAKGPNERFHAVVANPPYVASSAIGALAPEIRDYDPRTALDGGPDGLAGYRAILQRTDSLLDEGGYLAFEVGYDQSDAVGRLCAEAGLNEIGVHRDLAGNGRVVTGMQTNLTYGSEEQKKRLEKSGGRASFAMQTRAKPQS